MDPAATHARLHVGLCQPLPPAIAGVLAAWLRAGGTSVEVLREGLGAEGHLWVALEAPFSMDDLATLVADGAVPDRSPALPAAAPDGAAPRRDAAPPRNAAAPPICTLFGPALADPTLAADVARRCPGARIVTGDPTGVADLSALPITTWAGFDLPRGAPRRILAGRRDRVRPIAHVLREISYAVEMQGVGHVFFDDEDLAHYGDWLPKFERELARLPWPLRWEATVDGARESGGRLS